MHIYSVVSGIFDWKKNMKKKSWNLSSVLGRGRIQSRFRVKMMRIHNTENLPQTCERKNLKSIFVFGAFKIPKKHKKVAWATYAYWEWGLFALVVQKQKFHPCIHVENFACNVCLY